MPLTQAAQEEMAKAIKQVKDDRKALTRRHADQIIDPEPAPPPTPTTSPTTTATPPPTTPPTSTLDPETLKKRRRLWWGDALDE